MEMLETVLRKPIASAFPLPLKKEAVPEPTREAVGWGRLFLWRRELLSRSCPKVGTGPYTAISLVKLRRCRLAAYCPVRVGLSAPTPCPRAADGARTARRRHRQEPGRRRA
jgi:hypothetical protein